MFNWKLRKHLHALKGAKLQVLTCLTLHMNAHWRAWPHQTTIAKETGYNASTINSAIKCLINMGAIGIVPVDARIGKQEQSLYQSALVYQLTGAIRIDGAIVPYLTEPKTPEIADTICIELETLGLEINYWKIQLLENPKPVEVIPEKEKDSEDTPSLPPTAAARAPAHEAIPTNDEAETEPSITGKTLPSPVLGADVPAPEPDSTLTVFAQDTRPEWRKTYDAIKAQYPDRIVLYRMGDFYEAFDADAKLIASALDLTLAERRSGKGRQSAMAGFPWHTADGYIDRLIKAGYRVAAIDQDKNARLSDAPDPFADKNARPTPPLFGIAENGAWAEADTHSGIQDGTPAPGGKVLQSVPPSAIDWATNRAQELIASGDATPNGKVARPEQARITRLHEGGAHSDGSAEVLQEGVSAQLQIVTESPVPEWFDRSHAAVIREALINPHRQTFGSAKITGRDPAIKQLTDAGYLVFKRANCYALTESGQALREHPFVLELGAKAAATAARETERKAAREAQTAARPKRAHAPKQAPVALQEEVQIIADEIAGCRYGVRYADVLNGARWGVMHTAQKFHDDGLTASDVRLVQRFFDAQEWTCKPNTYYEKVQDARDWANKQGGAVNWNALPEVIGGSPEAPDAERSLDAEEGVL